MDKSRSVPSRAAKVTKGRRVAEWFGSDNLYKRLVQFSQALWKQSERSEFDPDWMSR